MLNFGAANPATMAAESKAAAVIFLSVSFIKNLLLTQPIENRIMLNNVELRIQGIC